MKFNTPYSILLTTGLLLALSACQRTDDPQDAVLDTAEIQVGAGEVEETKGFLDQGDLDVDGMKVKVFDYLSGYNGTISEHTNGEEFLYIDDTVLYDTNNTSDWKWQFVGGSYRWTRTGTHKFLGWLSMDPHDNGFDAASFFTTYNPNFSDGNHYLELNKTLTISDDHQFDFLYSDIVSVDATTRSSNTVPLPMKHLFAGFAFTLINNSTSAITIKSITIPDFPNNGTVRIDYGDLTGNVTLTAADPVDSETDYFSNAFGDSGITLPAKVQGSPGQEYDVFTGAPVTSTYNYRMAWPVSQAKLSPENEFPEAQRVGDDVNRMYQATDSLIVLKYFITGMQQDRTTRLKIPKLSSDENDLMALSAGKKTRLTLQFLDKQILLKFTVNPWDYEEVPMAFEDKAISATQLKFDDTTCIIGEEDAEGSVPVTVSNGMTIKGSFSIYTPIGGQLVVGASGDTSYFSITPSAITINPSRDGGKINLRIQPIKDSGGTERRIKLHFAVLQNGRETSADSEINRDNYTIILE